ncbi:MAG: zinc-ribbon domain-containing protein [Candidatus Lokiarchaeota archaeon]|nr:zinc-ribbon domain-containing protein [Candidatus Lokiarchaeota archaeon]
MEPKQVQEIPQIKNAVIFYRRIAFCPFCGSKISDEGQELCSSCGADLNEGD